jgi:hypothetical protein
MEFEFFEDEHNRLPNSFVVISFFTREEPRFLRKEAGFYLSALNECTIGLLG